MIKGLNIFDALTKTLTLSIMFRLWKYPEQNVINLGNLHYPQLYNSRYKSLEVILTEIAQRFCCNNLNHSENCHIKVN